MDSIEVEVGKTFSLQLLVDDPDGDNVTFHLLEQIENASITEKGEIKQCPLVRCRLFGMYFLVGMKISNLICPGYQQEANMVCVLFISTGGLFKWTPQNSSIVSVKFIATDHKANATLEPIVKLCNCMNNGTCLYDQYFDDTSLITDRFGVSIDLFSV